MKKKKAIQTLTNSEPHKEKRALLPMYHDQFTLLFKHGELPYSTYDLISIESFDHAGVPCVNSETLWTSLPIFDYEESLVLLEIYEPQGYSPNCLLLSQLLATRHNLPPQLCTAIVEWLEPEINLNRISTIQTKDVVRIEDVLRVYPLTEIAFSKLKYRIPQGVKLNPPVFGKEISKLLIQRQQQDIFKGITAMFTICSIDQPKHKFPIENIAKALDYRVEGKKPSGHDHFFTKIICYDRHDFFPKTDFGYFYDLGKIHADVYGAKLDQTGFYRQFLVPNQELYSKYDISQLIELFIQDPNTQKIRGQLSSIDHDNLFIICVLFLKYVTEIRNRGSVANTNLIDVFNRLSKSYKEQTATALYLLGGFFGYKNLYEDLYRVKKIKLFESLDAPTMGKEYAVGAEIVSQSFNEETPSQYVGGESSEFWPVLFSADALEFVRSNSTQYKKLPEQQRRKINDCFKEAEKKLSNPSLSFTRTFDYQFDLFLSLVDRKNRGSKKTVTRLSDILVQDILDAVKTFKGVKTQA